MKKLILLLSAAFIYTGATFAQNDCEEGDTTKFKLGTATIIIIQDTTDVDNHKQKDEKYTWEGEMTFGTTGYLTPSGSFTMPVAQRPMEIDYTRSWALSFASQLKGFDLVKDRIYISPGLGITWNNYFFKNNIAIHSTSDTTTFTFDTITNNNKYKLRTTYIDIPLLVGFRIGDLKHPLGIQAGVIGSYNLGNIVKQKYQSNGNKIKNRTKDDYNINPFKLEAVARVKIKNVGIYGRYSLTSLFENGKAPELYPFSAGIIFSEL